MNLPKNPPFAFGSSVSLRLGHASVLTVHRTVIHCLGAASLLLARRALKWLQELKAWRKKTTKSFSVRCEKPFKVLSHALKTAKAVLGWVLRRKTLRDFLDAPTPFTHPFSRVAEDKRPLRISAHVVGVWIRVDEGKRPLQIFRTLR